MLSNIRKYELSHWLDDDDDDDDDDDWYFTATSVQKVG